MILSCSGFMLLAISSDLFAPHNETGRYVDTPASLHTTYIASLRAGFAEIMLDFV